MNDPKATAAFDQLGGVVSDIRAMVVAHYKGLVECGMNTDAAGMLASEVQTTLLAALLSKGTDE